MKASHGSFYSIIGCLLFASPEIFVTSFSTVERSLRYPVNCLVSLNRNFATTKKRSDNRAGSCSRFSYSLGKCNDESEAKIIRNMVCEDNNVDSIQCSEYDTEIENLQQRSIWKYLIDWFQGDFDNYSQVLEDREQNLEPREGGGHEHFHCTLVPVTESSRLAAFFFDGNPDRIFRFRYYEMIPPSGNGKVIEMKLNTLHPDLEKLLKSQASNPLSWPSVFETFQPTNEKETKVNRLKNCEISWSFERDSIQHSYLKDVKEENENNHFQSLHAVMINGPTIVNSTMVPGMQIRIIDQLSLYKNTFYINDRGFDPITGSFIYGNQREIPYRLERVSFIASNINNSTTNRAKSLPTSSNIARLQRVITNEDLKWTMGPDYRSTEQYDRKLELIGGPSVGMNKIKFKKK